MGTSSMIARGATVAAMAAMALLLPPAGLAAQDAPVRVSQLAGKSVSRVPPQQIGPRILRPLPSQRLRTSPMFGRREASRLPPQLPSTTRLTARQRRELLSRLPVLSIDAGMHAAPINRISADSACRLLATASDDKTVRLWRLPGGKLLDTLRVPVGAGNEGRNYAVAVAPDGSWVAVGGWSVGGEHAVQIFQTSTGQVRSRLGPLGSVVNHLAVSADGRYLAAMLGSGAGVRIWEKGDTDPFGWRAAGEDKDYGGQSSFGGAFDASGALFTVAFDGKLRRYAGPDKAPSTAPTSGGKQPFSLAVHPSNGTVAVGFHDTPAVEVYDAATLKRAFAADTQTFTRGSLAAVAWSKDGKSLYAGGEHANSSGSRLLVAWDRGGRGPSRGFASAREDITSLLTCDEAIVAATAGPAFGAIPVGSGERLWLEGAALDFRATDQQDYARKLAMSADGRRVRLPLGGREGPVAVFDLAAGRLSEGAQAAADLHAPDTTTIPVTGWMNDRNPRLADKPLTLSPNERAQALAVAPDAERFVLGTEWLLRAYDREGKSLWQAQAASAAWAVNIAKDGKLVVAAHADGTVRWRRLADGKELLALFVHATDRRWVAWTPSGYYTASPGGEDLIGWHVNRGWSEAADFFPAHRFRNQFYRPDVVAQVLQLLDEDKAVTEADRVASIAAQEREIYQLLPPVVEILSPRDGERFASSKVVLEYSVRTPTGDAASQVDVYLDDAKLAGKGFVPIAAGGKGTASLELDLPRRNVKVTLVARAGEKASQPRSIELVWSGPAQEAKPRPRLLALLVGVSAYRQEGLKLDFAHQDALKLAAALQAQEGKAFLKIETNVLVDADRAAIMDGLKWLEDRAQDGDLTIILFSGHGTTQHNTFFFLPVDADPANLRRTGVSGHDIVGTVQGLPGGKILLIDACRAAGGLAPAGLRQVSVDVNKLANDMGQPVGAIFFGSSGIGEYSYEDARLKAGAFTAALIEGLAGKADAYGEGRIDTAGMNVWLRKRVPELTERRQTPLRHQSAPVEYTIAGR